MKKIYICVYTHTPTQRKTLKKKKKKSLMNVKKWREFMLLNSNFVFHSYALQFWTAHLIAHYLH